MIYNLKLLDNGEAELDVSALELNQLSHFICIFVLLLHLIHKILRSKEAVFFCKLSDDLIFV